MSDRSEERRLAALRRDIAKAEPGLQLDDEKIDIILQAGYTLLVVLDYLGAADDGRAINAMCDILEPELTMVIDDRHAA